MTWLGAKRVHLDSCRSTNDEAARLAADGAAHGTVVTAGAQTHGRGRQGRSWYCPPGQNLYLSCIVRPSLPPGKIQLITLAAGVAVCDAVNFYGAGASLKWPNDVLVGRKKIAGALTEMHTQGNRVDSVVLGIGVNVCATEFRPELSGIATSVWLAGDAEPSVDDVAERLLAELETRLDALLAERFDSIRESWLERAGLPRRVTADVASGDAVDLTQSGALVIRDDAGARHEVISGDVQLLWGDE